MAKETVVNLLYQFPNLLKSKIVSSLDVLERQFFIRDCSFIFIRYSFVINLIRYFCYYIVIALF